MIQVSVHSYITFIFALQLKIQVFVTSQKNTTLLINAPYKIVLRVVNRISSYSHRRVYFAHLEKNLLSRSLATASRQPWARNRSAKKKKKIARTT
jgi:hypothetical protein